MDSTSISSVAMALYVPLCLLSFLALPLLGGVAARHLLRSSPYVAPPSA